MDIDAEKQRIEILTKTYEIKDLITELEDEAFHNNNPEEIKLLYNFTCRLFARLQDLLDRMTKDEQGEQQTDRTGESTLGDRIESGSTEEGHEKH